MVVRDIDDSRLVGSRIRELRVQKGMSQATLAEKANLSLPQISSIELGKSRMLLSSFIRITEALQVSADLLLRPDVPEVKNIYKSEFSELLNDCTVKEIEAILKIVKELKDTMHAEE